MQNPALEKSNGAIWCKLWPKAILTGDGQKSGVFKGQLERKNMILHNKKMKSKNNLLISETLMCF